MNSAVSPASMRASTAQRTPAARQQPPEEPRTLLLGTEEAAVLKLDLSDLPLPKVGGLEVDGFKPSFFERLFGKGRK